MIDILSFAILGSLAGVVVGLIPGIGPAQLLAVAYVALLALDPIQLAVFYIGLITTSQYLDSVPATYFGVPGETSAVPPALKDLDSWPRGWDNRVLDSLPLVVFLPA